MNRAASQLDHSLRRGIEQELLGVWRQNLARLGLILLIYYGIRIITRTTSIARAWQAESFVVTMAAVLLLGIAVLQFLLALRFRGIARTIHGRLDAVHQHRRFMVTILALGVTAAFIIATVRANDAINSISTVSMMLYAVMWLTLLSGVLVPWTIREGFVTLGLSVGIVLISSGAMTLLCLTFGRDFTDATLDAIMASLVVPLIFAIALPSVLLTFATSALNRLRERLEVKVLRHMHVQQRQSLFDARRIHESRFPAPLLDGPVRVEYFYEPMRQIGGDFLQLHRSPQGRLHLDVIDVTGHGIAAALSVNRIDGEMRRLYAERADLPPEQLAAGLNRYLNLTLARHSVYATAMCLSLTDSGHVTFVNAGHPPAFLRRRDGRVVRLQSTAFILGVCPDGIFEAQSDFLQLAPGETIVIYTDGACESTDSRGRQLGIEGLARALEAWNPESGAPLIRFLPEAVRRFRHGPPKDDVLFVVLHRAA